MVKCKGDLRVEIVFRSRDKVTLGSCVLMKKYVCGGGDRGVGGHLYMI